MESSLDWTSLSLGRFITLSAKLTGYLKRT
jgi:hypothetical protein